MNSVGARAKAAGNFLFAFGYSDTQFGLITLASRIGRLDDHRLARLTCYNSTILSR
jgi:hypothetical protein